MLICTELTVLRAELTVRHLQVADALLLLRNDALRHSEG
jgi:hypothetical protein